MTTLSASPVRAAWARPRSASCSQARRLCTPVSGSVVAAVRSRPASRIWISVITTVATTTGSQAAAKPPGRAAYAPALATATSSSTCSRAARGEKKCAAYRPTAIWTGPSPTIPTAVADRQASSPMSRLSTATATCSTGGHARAPSHQSSAPPPSPTTASARSRGTGVAPVIGRRAPSRQSVPQTA
jgi:hypothetical protein